MNKIKLLIYYLVINFGNLNSQNLFCYYEPDPNTREYIMNVEEDLDHNLITTSLVNPYDHTFKSHYTTIRKLNSQCQLLKKIQIYKDSFTVLLSRVYVVDSGYMAIGSLRSWVDSLQFYVYILSFDFDLNKRYEKIIPLKPGLEPWWYMGKQSSNNQITCVVSVSDYPAPISSGPAYNLFISSNYYFNDLKLNLYKTSNYTYYCWDMERTIDDLNFWCPGTRFLLIDSLMNLRDSVLQPYKLDLCSGNVTGLRKFDNSSYLYVATACTDTNRNVFLMKLDKNLKPGKPISFGTMDFDIANPGRCLDWKNKNKIYVGGMNYNYNFVDPITFFLGSFDENLNTRWIKFFGGDYFYRLLSVCSTSDGGCILGGEVSYNKNQNESDVFLIKVDSSGIITKNKDIKNVLTWNFSLYPNPSQDFFILDYQNLTGKCSFEMMDQFGKRLIFQKLNPSGKQMVQLTNLIPGTYYYRIISNNKLLGSGSWFKI